MSNSRRPDDKPFDFNLDAYVKGLELEPWVFHWADRPWKMAHFDGIDSKDTKKAVQVGDDDEILKLAMGADQFAEFDEIPIPNGGKSEMVKRYFKHCGVDVGELQGSTGS